MEYTVYVDSLLLEEFVVSLYTLELVRICVCCTATHKRICCGAVLETLLFAGLLGMGAVSGVGLSPVATSIWIFCSALLVNGTAFGKRVWRRPFRILGGYVLCKLMLSGILSALIDMAKAYEKKFSYVPMLVFIGAMTTLCLCLFFRKKKESLMATVTVVHKEQKVCCTGFLDSGNGLVEPISGAPVCVIRKELAELLVTPEDISNYRVIPFSSIGKNNGILEAFQIQRLVIKTNLDTYSYEGVWIALCSKENWKSDRYQMILHGDFINR